MGGKIQSFTDLRVWQEGHRLVLEIYKITKTFPSDERFGLIDQMRRCSVSITSNIAEGFSRKGKKEKAQFLYMALGSVTELQNQLLISKDLKYISRDNYDSTFEKSINISKMLNGLIKSLQLYS